MQVLNEEPTETLHLYIVPEDQLPKKPDYFSIFMIFVGLVCIFALIYVSVFSEASQREVSFPVTIQGFHLTPVSKTVQTTVIATGKGHMPATTATGMVTFYNGALYTQIIPTGTILKGADGVSVITDQQAVIPPAAQTTPPTYGHTSVSAHALVPGVQGNISAGDINMACCVSSVIAQNPYNFTRGSNARNFTYLTKQDIVRTLSPLLPTLQASTLSLLPTPQLNSSCVTVTRASPGVGKETPSAQLTIVETCSAISYSVSSVVHAITTHSKHFGKGIFTHMQFFVVGVKNEVITLYVVGRFVPFAIRTFPTIGK